MVEFHVEHGDVTRISADLLLLKYARGFYGADLQTSTLLIEGGRCSRPDIQPSINDVAVVESRGVIAPQRVMFLGTSHLSAFGYEEMRKFARSAIHAIVDQALPVQMLTTTVHGVGYGLDAGEALQSLVLGFQQGLAARQGNELAQITFVERNPRRARMLAQALTELGIRPADATTLANSVAPRITARQNTFSHEPEPTLPPAKVAAPVERPKEHVFVAMAFAEDFQDVYEFGIYEPMRRCGYICEHVDEAQFTGDILQRIKERIRSAKFLIADLTGARPNVYLEVGYAWGHNVPVILLARKGEQLHFDVTTHRCIFYSRIGQLAKDLEKLIQGL